MLSGWLARGLDPRSVVRDRAASLRRDQRAGRKRHSPQSVAEGCRQRRHAGGGAEAADRSAKPAPTLKPFAGPSTLVVSIMAGTTIASIAQVCGGSVVRAMPNTPAAIGRGITVAVAANNVSAAQRAVADALLRATGSVEWVDDEKLDGRGDRGLRLRARPMSSCSPRNWRAPASKPACRRSSRQNSRAKPSPAPANCCIARSFPPRRCARTSPRPAAPRPRRWKC